MFRWPNGEFYEGQYRRNQRHGKGVYHYSNGVKGHFEYDFNRKKKEKFEMLEDGKFFSFEN